MPPSRTARLYSCEQLPELAQPRVEALTGELDAVERRGQGQHRRQADEERPKDRPLEVRPVARADDRWYLVLAKPTREERNRVPQAPKERGEGGGVALRVTGF